MLNEIVDLLVQETKNPNIFVLCVEQIKQIFVGGSLFVEHNQIQGATKTNPVEQIEDLLMARQRILVLRWELENSMLTRSTTR